MVRARAPPDVSPAPLPRLQASTPYLPLTGAHCAILASEANKNFGPGGMAPRVNSSGPVGCVRRSQQGVSSYAWNARQRASSLGADADASSRLVCAPEVRAGEGHMLQGCGGRGGHDFLERAGFRMGARDTTAVYVTGAVVTCSLRLHSELRELLVDEDSENYTVFSDAERDELLLRIFRHCVLGGGMCQYEDMVQPYFEVSKKLYKGLLAVRKHEETGKIEILTEVFSLKSVRASDRGAPSLFPGRSPYRPQLLSLCFFPSVPLCLVVSVSLPLCFCLFVFVFLSAFSVMFQLEVSLHSTFWRQETGDRPAV